MNCKMKLGKNSSFDEFYREVTGKLTFPTGPSPQIAEKNRKTRYHKRSRRY